jgi:hypothetical protein
MSLRGHPIKLEVLRDGFFHDMSRTTLDEDVAGIKFEVRAWIAKAVRLNPATLSLNNLPSLPP